MIYHKKDLGDKVELYGGHTIVNKCKWSNMIGCEMGSLPAKVYISATTSPIKNFKHRWKTDVVVNMAIFLAREVLRKLGFLGNFKPLAKKLGLPMTPT